MKDHDFLSGQNPETQFVPNMKNTASSSDGIFFYLKDFAVMLSVFLLVFTFLIKIVVVSGTSMNATLLDGDYVFLLGNLFYKEPKAGDIIVVSKTSFEDGEPIIKRVIATAGQTVDIDFSEGIVYVDGTALDEPYINTPTNLYEGIRFPIKVDEGCLFVLGDNRNHSKDSRNPEIGLVDKREVIGKAVCILFPGNNKGIVKRDFERIGVLS